MSTALSRTASAGQRTSSALACGSSDRQAQTLSRDFLWTTDRLRCRMRFSLDNDPTALPRAASSEQWAGCVGTSDFYTRSAGGSLLCRRTIPALG